MKDVEHYFRERKVLSDKCTGSIFEIYYPVTRVMVHVYNETGALKGMSGEVVLPNKWRDNLNK